MRRWALITLVLLGCAPARPGSRSPTKVVAMPPAPPAPRCLAADRKQELDALVAQNEERYAAAITRARAFLDALDVDPIDLRAHRIKGKKKLVEALDAYWRLFQVTPAEQRKPLLDRVKVLTAVTREDRYHDLLIVSDQELREDATSYLRAAYLMDKMGVDVTRYRQEIESAKWRIDAQMKQRGAHQKRVFHTYYQHFGLIEPFPLDAALEQGLIARRADPKKLARLDLYALTHEVFAAYAYGDDLDDDSFNDADRAYLREALPVAIRLTLDAKDADLTAELLACMRFLRFVDLPSYAEGLRYLLDAQNPDGSWGSYEREEKRLFRYVKQGYYLHTTMVAIDALALAFAGIYRSGEGAVCGAATK